MNTNPKPYDANTAPSELKNQIYRRIWASQSHARSAIFEAEEKRWEGLLKTEKVRLGLPEDENIVMRKEVGSAYSKIFVALAFVMLALFAAGAEWLGDPVSFAVMTVGFLLLWVALIMRRPQVVYLTTFRLLVSKKGLFSRVPRWTALHYHEVLSVDGVVRFGGRSVILNGEGPRQVILTGLNAATVRAIAETVSRYADL